MRDRSYFRFRIDASFGSRILVHGFASAAEHNLSFQGAGRLMPIIFNPKRNCRARRNPVHAVFRDQEIRRCHESGAWRKNDDSGAPLRVSGGYSAERFPGFGIYDEAMRMTGDLPGEFLQRIKRKIALLLFSGAGAIPFDIFPGAEDHSIKQIFP